MIVRQLGACFVQSKNGIGLMNGGKKWYGPETIWFAFACDYDMVVLDDFNIVSCEYRNAIIITELQE